MMGIEIMDDLVEFTFFDSSMASEKKASAKSLDARRMLDEKFEEQRLFKEIQEFDFE